MILRHEISIEELVKKAPDDNLYLLPDRKIEPKAFDIRTCTAYENAPMQRIARIVPADSPVLSDGHKDISIERSTTDGFVVVIQWSIDPEWIQKSVSRLAEVML